MVMAVVFEFSVMRCQPLRRALVSLGKIHQKLTHKVLKIQHLAFKLHNLAFGVFLMLIWSKALKVL
ncbi:acetyltransferase [Vibrio cholerae]|nr:acetyltransferase [Vibrio cholerae]EGQ9579628.1 acetyltransferase [Vibrio cholerae]EGR5013317.1 acetyltransferase [Vibrio cholerae]